MNMFKDDKSIAFKRDSFEDPLLRRYYNPTLVHRIDENALDLLMAGIHEKRKKNLNVTV